MTITQQPNRYLSGPQPSGLADVINTILDKGLVIDVYIRVSLVGIELLTIDARIVVASVDTYLRFARAVNRLDLTETETHGIPELMQDITESGAKGKTSGALEGVKEKVGEALGGNDDGGDDGRDRDDRPRRRSSSRQGERSSDDEGRGERRPRRRERQES